MGTGIEAEIVIVIAARIRALGVIKRHHDHFLLATPYLELFNMNGDGVVEVVSATAAAIQATGINDTTVSRKIRTPRYSRVGRVAGSMAAPLADSKVRPGSSRA